MNIQELFKEQRKQEKKQHRKEWLIFHAFDLVDLFIALAALVIAIIGLVLK